MYFTQDRSASHEAVHVGLVLEPDGVQQLVEERQVQVPDYCLDLRMKFIIIFVSFMLKFCCLPAYTFHLGLAFLRDVREVLYDIFDGLFQAGR